jgi:hypothetical protein
LDYWYDDTWTYTNYSCTMPALDSERFWKEGDRLLYVPTAYKETRYQQARAPNTSDCNSIEETCSSGWEKSQDRGGICTCTESSHHLIVGAAAFSLRFAHSYRMPNVDITLGSNVAGSAQRSDRPCCPVDGSNVVNCFGLCDSDWGDGAEMRTIIVVKDADGTEKLLSVFTAPEFISVPLTDVFAKAGLNLDSDSPTIPNQLSCGTPGAKQPCRDDVADMPRARQTGLNILIFLEYQNRYAEPDLPEECDDKTVSIQDRINCLYDGDRKHTGPTCKATISLETLWQSRPRSDCDVPKNSLSGESSCTLRYYQGMKISFSESGGFGIIDPFFIVLAVGAALVYLSVPLMIIHEVAVGFLGTLSDVYWKADNQDVILVQQLAGFVVRMVTSQMAFSGLAGGDNEAITPTMLLERIDQCLSVGGHSGLTPEDKIKLTEICMNHLDKLKDGKVLMNEFVEAVSSSDPINLRNTIDLFDESRAPSILERIFTPRSWRNDRKVRKYFPRREDGSFDVSGIYSEVQEQRDRLADRAKGIDEMADAMSSVSGGVGSRGVSSRDIHDVPSPRPSPRAGTAGSGAARRSSRASRASRDSTRNQRADVSI